MVYKGKQSALQFDIQRGEQVTVVNSTTGEKVNGFGTFNYRRTETNQVAVKFQFPADMVRICNFSKKTGKQYGAIKQYYLER